MDTQTNALMDRPETVPEGLPERLRDAREQAGLSRAKLAARTGIPAKSIEKFERGEQEPSVSRLLTLSQALGLSFDALIGKEESQPVPGPPPRDLAPTPSAMPPAAPVPAEEPDEADPVAEIIEELDDLRADGFDTAPRRAMALVNELRRILKFAESDELLRIAEARGLYKSECPSPSGLWDIFRQEPTTAQEYCGLLEERIIDTAILGADLFAIEAGALRKLASKLDQEFDLTRPSFLSWGEHEDFVPVIREPLRDLAFSGRPVSFQDPTKFPRRPL